MVHGFVAFVGLACDYMSGVRRKKGRDADARERRQGKKEKEKERIG